MNIDPSVIMLAISFAQQAVHREFVPANSIDGTWKTINGLEQGAMVKVRKKM